MVARRTIAAARQPACRVSALPLSWDWINRRDAHLQASGEMISGHLSHSFRQRRKKSCNHFMLLTGWDE